MRWLLPKPSGRPLDIAGRAGRAIHWVASVASLLLLLGIFGALDTGGAGWLLFAAVIVGATGRAARYVLADE